MVRVMDAAGVDEMGVLAAQLLGRNVQLAAGVFKDTQARAFLRQLFADVQRVGVPHAQKDHQPAANGARRAAVHNNVRRAHALDDSSHRSFLRAFFPLTRG